MISQWTYTDRKYAPSGAPVGTPEPKTLCITTEWPNWATEDGIDRPGCTINTWDGKEWDDNNGFVVAWQPLVFPKPAKVLKRAWPEGPEDAHAALAYRRKSEEGT